MERGCNERPAVTDRIADLVFRGCGLAGGIRRQPPADRRSLFVWHPSSVQPVLVERADPPVCGGADLLPGDGTDVVVANPGNATDGAAWFGFVLLLPAASGGTA